MLHKIRLFGIDITNASKEEVLEYVEDSLTKKQKKYYIVTPNPELIMLANKNPLYKNILNHADLALCDGVGLLLASRFLGKSIKQRLPGADCMNDLCSRFAKKPITVGFLGGKPGVAEKVVECLHQKFPELKVSFAVGELSELKNKPKGEHGVSSQYKDEHEKIFTTQYVIPDTDILFVAFGSPKQEEWISQNIDSLPVRVVMGVGGAFDFIAGTVRRAPDFVRRFGLEWLYRLVRQPWRIKRQLALLQFIALVLAEKKKEPTL